MPGLDPIRGPFHHAIFPEVALVPRLPPATRCVPSGDRGCPPTAPNLSAPGYSLCPLRGPGLSCTARNLSASGYSLCSLRGPELSCNSSKPFRPRLLAASPPGTDEVREPPAHCRAPLIGLSRKSGRDRPPNAVPALSSTPNFFYWTAISSLFHMTRSGPAQRISISLAETWWKK